MATRNAPAYVAVQAQPSGRVGVSFPAPRLGIQGARSMKAKWLLSVGALFAGMALLLAVAAGLQAQGNDGAARAYLPLVLRPVAPGATPTPTATATSTATPAPGGARVTRRWGEH